MVFGKEIYYTEAGAEAGAQSIVLVRRPFVGYTRGVDITVVLIIIISIADQELLFRVERPFVLKEDPGEGGDGRLVSTIIRMGSGRGVVVVIVVAE